jgi:hypothetical protein
MASQGARIGYIDSDLAGFRIHGASISGSGTLQSLYLQDCRRIFRQVRGRDWRGADAVRRLAHRAVSYVWRQTAGRIR